jgi:large subunit ribosomal protein L17
MHRHGYVGRKLGRKRDERRRLLMNLATSLVLDEHLTTTRAKAKELVPYVERLVSKARKGDLHNRRQVIAGLMRDDAAAKLVDSLAPQMQRDSGFVRIKPAGKRQGDGSELRRVSFVDEFKAIESTEKKKSAAKPAAAKSSASKSRKPAAKPARTAKKPAAKAPSKGSKS